MRYVVACEGCKREKDVGDPEKLVAAVMVHAQTVRNRIKQIIDAKIPGTTGVGIVFKRVCPACDTKKEQKSYEFNVVRMKT